MLLVFWKKHQVLQALLHSDANVMSEKSQNTVGDRVVSIIKY